MGIFDRSKAQSGNQAEEEQQDGRQPADWRAVQRPGRPRGMQTAQNTIGQQGGPQDPGSQNRAALLSPRAHGH
jgi:hypothetical protein